MSTGYRRHPLAGRERRWSVRTRAPQRAGLALVVGLGMLTFGVHASPVAADPDAQEVRERRRGKDRLDRQETSEIRRAVTDPAFSNEWVDHVPDSRRVPSPRDFLGYAVGAPDMLTPPEKIVEYMRLLAKKSPKVQVVEMGESHGGREMIAVAVGRAKHLRRLDKIAAANADLADPRETSRADAEKIADSTPLLYWMTAGLHSPETGPPEMVMELAYRLAVSEQEHITEVLDDVVVMISPVLEMDGRARMVDWWRRHLQDVEDLEDSPPRMAPYWGDYTAHDNNRDGLQLSQALTKNYVDFYHRFHPIVSLDLHESVPLLYVSTGTGPYNESIDPITVTEWQAFSSHEVSEATRLGLKGVWTWGFYTGWYPGYLLWVTNNHNAVGRFYETFGNSNPGTFDRDLRSSSFADVRVNSRTWYRAWPPPKELRWSLRNNTNYMQTGVLSSLRYAARNRRELLLNFWTKGNNSIEAGRSRGARAFVIPAAQRDLGALAEMIALLKGHRIELHRATAASTYGELKIESGDFIVRMDQPYRNLAWTLLQAQTFPKDAAHTPYDDVAWSLDLMLGVEVSPVNDPAVLTSSMIASEGDDVAPGTVEGAAPWVVEHLGQAELMTLLYGLKNANFRGLATGVDGAPAGSVVIDGITTEALREFIEGTHLRVRSATAAMREAATIDIKPARIGLFHTWRYTQDSGWARFTLESLGIPYTLIDKDDLRTGDLAARFDVVLVPSQGGMSFANMVHGIDTKWSPLAYTSTPEFPSHGVIDSSPDITGGMGYAGLSEIERFVQGGGVLLALGSAGKLAAEGGLARGVSVKTVSNPGSHITVRALRPEHPLSFGYDETSYVFRGNFPIYDVREFDRGMTVFQYGAKTWREAEREADKKAHIEVGADQKTSGAKSDGAAADVTGADGDETSSLAATKEPAVPLVRSGLVKKPEALSRAPAVLDVPVGDGRIIFMSFNPLHRHQNRHDFALVGNVFAFWNDLPAPLGKEEMRRR